MLSKSGRVVAIVALLAAGGVALAGDAKPPEPNPAEPVDYVAWFNETYGAGIERNAADEYAEACRLLGPVVDDYGQWSRRQWGKCSRGPWEGVPALAIWLKAAKPALEAYDRAALMEGCHLKYTHPEPDAWNTPENFVQQRARMSLLLAECMLLGDLRCLVQARLAVAWGKWQRGDREELPAAACIVLRCARQLLKQPGLMERMYGMALTSSACSSLLRAASLSGDAPAFAARVLPELSKLDRNVRPFADVLAIERLKAVDVAQRICLKEKPGGWLGLENVAAGALKAIVGVNGHDAGASLEAVTGAMAGKYDFESTFAAIDEHYSQLDRLQPLRFRYASRLWDELESSTKEQGHPLLRFLVPGTVRAFVLDTRREARTRATFLVLHILAHRHDTGAYPVTLSDVPALKEDKELRTDPFTDAEFIYRRTADGFTLYSVGMDFDDDGGKHDKKWGESDGGGDFVFWPVPGAG